MIHTTKEYNNVIKRCKELFLHKTEDYDTAWRIMRPLSITDLILIKTHRAKQIEDNNGQTLVSERLKPNYRHMLNYAGFALIKVVIAEKK